MQERTFYGSFSLAVHQDNQKAGLPRVWMIQDQNGDLWCGTEVALYGSFLTSQPPAPPLSYGPTLRIEPEPGQLAKAVLQDPERLST
jgi:hypothetical protein